MNNHFDEVINNFIKSSAEHYKNELDDKYVGKTCKVITDDFEITGKVTDIKVAYDNFYYDHLVVDVKLETWIPSDVETDTEDGWFSDVSIELVTL